MSPTRSEELAALLRLVASDWTPEQVRVLVTQGQASEGQVDNLARVLERHPEFWNVSDNEFIAAVRLVNPQSAALLATPAGLNLMHSLSRALAVKVGVMRVQGVLGWLGG